MTVLRPHMYNAYAVRYPAGMKSTGIYEIVHVASGRRYVGQAICIKGRWAKHRHHLNKGGHHSPHFRNAWKKYGADAFVFRIIEECSADQLDVREQHHIDQTPVALRFNLYPAASSPRGYKHSAATREKLTLKHWSKTADSETKAARYAQISARSKALWADPEHRATQSARRSVTMKARWADPEFHTRMTTVPRPAVSAAHKALWAEPEYRAKQTASRSVAMKTRWADPEYSAAQTARLKAYNEAKRSNAPKRVRQKKTGPAYWDQPERRAAQGVKMKGYMEVRWAKPGQRDAQAARMQAVWDDPEQRAIKTAQNKAHANKPERKTASSARLKALWADPEWAARRRATMKGAKRKGKAYGVEASRGCEASTPSINSMREVL